MDNESKKINSELFLVFYGSNVEMITTDKSKAESCKTEMKGKYSALNWTVGSIEDYGRASWRDGDDDL